MLDGSIATLRLCTVVLITTMAFTSQYYVLIPWFAQADTASKVSHLGPFNIGIILIYWTFYLACQDPGEVKRDWLPADEAQVRYCKTCKNFKPPRTHHCKSCNRCILKMDHHCPWLSGCVGYRNHAAFIKFMLSVIPTCIYLWIMMSARLYHMYQDRTWVSSAERDSLIWACLNLVRRLLPSSRHWQEEESSSFSL